MGRALAVIGACALACATTIGASAPARSAAFDERDRCAQAPSTDARQTPPQSGQGGKLPPRRAIGGVQVLETTSTVVFTAAPDRRHELVSTFAFPARARLQLTLQDDATLQRKLRYVYGEAAFALEPGAKASRELAGEDREEALAEVELRRATLLWPDGFEWSPNGPTREASAGALGTLRARTQDGARAPESIELVGANGARRLAFRAIRWSDPTERAGRAWPIELEVWRGESHIATETISAHETTRTYVDSFFLPADRRDGSTEHDAMIGVVRTQTLPRFCARRVALRAGSTWKEARAQIEALRAEWAATLERSSLALDPSWTVELDELAQPVALLVRTTTVPATPPEGFETSALRQARVVFVRTLEDASAERVAELQRAAPPQAKLHAPYVRYRPQDGQVLLVLPLAP